MSTYTDSAKFRGQRGLFPVADAAPVGQRCLQIQIPDSDAAVSMLFGALAMLTRWRNYDRDAAHRGREWAAAWLSAIRACYPLEGCEMPIEFMQDDCGLYFREIGAETWTQIYDGLHCLESDGARDFFDGLIGDYIDGLLDDGVLQRGGGQSSPQQPPSPGDCTVVHASVAPGSMFILPMQVNAGDTIEVSNVRGGWSIGELAWYCPDGYRYLLGVCAHDSYTTLEDDPLQTARHMQLIMLIDGVYYDALNGPVVVPAGVVDEPAYILANTGLTGVPSGGAWFDVEFCRNAAAEWTYHFQFATGKHNWTPATTENGCESLYSAGAWHACENSSHYTNVAIRPPFWDVDAFHLKAIRVIGYQGSTRDDGGKPLVFVHDDTTYVNVSTRNAVGAFDETWTGDLADVKLSRLIVCTSHPIDSTLTDVYISGSGYCPYIGQ